VARCCRVAGMRRQRRNFCNEQTREQITAELSKILDKNARVYLIGRGKKGRVVGRFVLGRRKMRPPWSGYAASTSEEEEEA
jgi:hypothetical protein